VARILAYLRATSIHLIKRWVAFHFVHHLANFIQASSPLWVFNAALTIPKPFFHLDLFHDRGFAVSLVILLYVVG
jgi:hypothetical protein